MSTAPADVDIDDIVRQVSWRRALACSSIGDDSALFLARRRQSY